MGIPVSVYSGIIRVEVIKIVIKYTRMSIFVKRLPLQTPEVVALHKVTNPDMQTD